MADETLTGSKVEVAVDTEKATSTKKLIIKIAVVVVVLVAAFWLYKKFVK